MPAEPLHRPVLAGNHRSLLNAVEHTPEHLDGWYPVLASADPCGVWWRHLGVQPFNESFFHDTLRAQPVGERKRTFTDFAALDDLATQLPLTALIFHVSRCGSTLITQMLSTLPHCVALSEPPVIDSLLYLYQQGQIDRPACVRILRGLVRALGQRRSQTQQHLFIKLDCWHLQDLDLLVEAFPGTHCLFLYREPLQVLASHQRQRGPQMLPGMLAPQWVQAPADLQPADLDRYCLHVLGRFMEVALSAARIGQVQLLNYRELPQAIPEHLLQSWGVACSDQQRAALLERSTRHAKYDQPFLGDPPPHPAAALGRAPEQAQLDHVQDLYQALERQYLEPIAAADLPTSQIASTQ